MLSPNKLLSTPEADVNVPLFDQIPELTPLRNAYGDLNVAPDIAGSPEAMYGHLLLAYDLLTAIPKNEVEATQRQDRLLDDAQRPFFDMVVGLQSQLSQNNSATALHDMITESRDTLTHTDWDSITLDGSQAATAEMMRLYLLTLLKGDLHTYKKVGGFLQRQYHSMRAKNPADTEIVDQADKFITRPWGESYPFTYETSFGFNARDDRKLARYYAMRSSGGLAAALSELTPHIKTVQDLTQQLFVQCEAFDIKRKFSAIVQVEWQLLPPGDLKTVAQELITEAQERRAKATAPLEVDLDRLQILEEVRKAWGPNTRYTRGIASGRRTAQTPEGEDVPNDYIVLVLQETNAQGEVIREHAVANSPITKNGLFIYRQDAQQNGKIEDWSVAFSLPKPDAVELGARRLVHPPRDTPRMVETMAQKAIHLLTCSPEQFSTMRFHGVDASGDVIVENRRQRAMRQAGTTALYSDIAADLRERIIQYF